MPIAFADLHGVAAFEDLARLFHERLNWPRQDWPTFGGVAALYGIPKDKLPAVASLNAVQKLDQQQQWGIFLVDFGDHEMRRSALRGILNNVAEKARLTHDNPVWPHDDILFICRHKGGFTLGHFRGDKLANAKLRRFGWENPLEARTAVENLNKLQWGQDWTEAFNVEKLTKDFFTKLSNLFFDAMQAIEKQIPNENERRLFIQTLFNRLIFLRFVEKKGWLKLDDREDYLRALWEASKNDKNPSWPTRLNALFNAVNYPTSNKIHKISKPLIGEVQYLNGGLFDEDHRFADPNIKIPDDVFEGLLGEDGLFYRYNFTVEESTPLDVQVAVDPEILGKIFEQLTISTKRHDTGSYYTPREIVQFMCREALVGYLQGKGLTEDKARALVYDHDDSALTNQQGNLAFEALKQIKVVDPACGSGAYLLGMLQELYALFELLRRDDRKFSDDPAKEAHDRKLHIIENNLYGVDIQQFATNTAMLRLWLTLLVEDTGETPQPLPNLEYKIETGDSLLGPDPSQRVHVTKEKAGQQVIYDSTMHKDIEDLRRLRERYQNAHGPEKNNIKAALDAKLAELREKVTGKAEKDPTKFDWRVEFFDVFLDDPAKRQPGFDVALANPPYVRQELIKDQKPALKAVFGEFFCGTADLYTYFYARAVQLLKPGGTLAFISSNKWFRAAYGEKLRAFMAENTDIRSITDFGELPVFGAATFPMIFVAQKRDTGVAPVKSAKHAPLFTQVKSLDPPYPDVKALIQQEGFVLPPDAIRGAEWTLADKDTLERLRRMEASGVPLGEYVKGKIYRGILTGFNEAFVIDGKKRAELIAEDPKSAEIIKPLAVGDDVRRCHIRKRDRWLIFTRRGVNIERYPAIKRHLMQWRTELEPRPRDWKPSKPGEEWPGRKPGSYKWYEIQDEIAYYAEFGKPRIVWPEIAKEPRFAVAEGGLFMLKTCFGTSVAEPFLLGIVNSGPAWEYLKDACSVLGDEDRSGRLTLQRVFVERLPIPCASDGDRAAIEALVQQILDLKAADPEADVSALEAEIDARVEFLYFHQSEAPTYDEWVAKREAEKGTVIEEIRKLLAIGHETDQFECKSSFSWDIKKGEPAEWLKDEVHTAICAMLNAKGGDVLIGVDDSMKVIGLEQDLARYGSKDKLVQAIENPLGKTLTPNPIGLVEIKPIDLDGKTIVRVKVKPDNTERYTFKDQIYVRRNSKSKPALTADEAASWWPKRQRGEV